MLFLHPKDRTIKGISREEISSFRCLGNFSVVYCKWNSLLSINHIKGKGLGDILSLHVLAWVKEKLRPGETRCLREMIRISSIVSVVVKCWRGASFLLWHQEITTRWENVVLWWTLKTRAQQLSHPVTSPRAMPWGCHSSPNLLHISSWSTVAGWNSSPLNPTLFHHRGHKILFSSQSPLAQKKTVMKGKFGVWFTFRFL